MSSSARLLLTDVVVEQTSAGRGGALALAGEPALLTRVEVRDATAQTLGGAVHASNRVEARRLVVRGAAAEQGGGVAVEGGHTRLLDSELGGVRAAGDGGGVLVTAGQASLVGTSVTGATAGGDGGGVAVHRGRAALSRTVVEGNRAEGSGGGLFATSPGSVTVTRGRLADNAAGDDGGALWVRGRAWVFDSEVEGNRAAGTGGGLRVDRGRLDLRRTSVGGNTATVGAGVASRSSWLRVQEADLAANEGFVGAGLHLSGAGSTTVDASRLGGQRASHAGGGVHADGLGPVTVRGSSFEDNVPDDHFLARAGAAAFLVDGVAVQAGPAPTGDTAVVAVEDAGRSLPGGDWLGVNGANLRNQRHLWSSPEFAEAVADLGPASIRLPGGSTSQYWDFATGLFVADEDVPVSISSHRTTDTAAVTLEQMADLSRGTGASTTWVVNMTTSTREEQVAALRRAVALGMDVERVALGNEMWTDDERVVAEYPEAEDYAAAVPAWATAVRRAVPGVEVAATGYCGGSAPGNPRKDTWDARVLPLVAEHVDAVSCHPYFSVSSGSTATPTTESAVRELVAQERRQAEAVRTLIDEVVPEGLDVWADEWGLLHTDAELLGTQLHGLLVADYGLGLLELDRVAHADLHALLGGRYSTIYGWTRVLDVGQPGVVRAGPVDVLGRSAVGESARLLFRATRGATSTAPLELVGGPDARARLARGARFDGPGGPRALVVNPTAEPLVVGTAGGGLAGATGGQTVAAAPHEAALPGTGPRPQPLVVAEDGALTLPAYSVTLVEL